MFVHGEFFVDFWAAPYLNWQRSRQFDSTCRLFPVVMSWVLHRLPPQNLQGLSPTLYASQPGNL